MPPDLAGVLVEETPEPAFLNEEGPSDDIPPFITRTNPREMFGMTEDDTVEDAMARHNANEGLRLRAVHRNQRLLPVEAPLDRLLFALLVTVIVADRLTRSVLKETSQT